MNLLKLEEAKKQIQSMLKHDFTQSLDSPYCNPILFVLKKDGDLRFCINYRWLNKKIMKNQCPLTSPKEMFDCLGKSKVFNKIGL